jgi:hypothetical protein
MAILAFLPSIRTDERSQLHKRNADALEIGKTSSADFQPAASLICKNRAAMRTDL